MARPTTREINFKNGYYIEVRQPGAQKGVKIRRETHAQIQRAISRYKKFYDIQYIGKIENGKVVEQ